MKQIPRAALQKKKSRKLSSDHIIQAPQSFTNVSITHGQLIYKILFSAQASLKGFPLSPAKSHLTMQNSV